MDTRRKFTFCRLCLCKSEVLMDIFQEDERLYTAAEVIIDLLRFHVSEDDGYSKFVCLRCFDKLSDFKIFKEQCVESKDTFEKEFLPSLRFAAPREECPDDEAMEGGTADDAEDIKREICGESEMGISNHDNVEREDIVVEVDIYPQMPPSPANNDEDVRTDEEKEDVQARDLSLHHGDSERLPNPYLKMMKKKQRKSRSSTGDAPPSKRSRKKQIPFKRPDTENDAVETWQEMLSRTGVAVMSCDQQMDVTNPGSTLEYVPGTLKQSDNEQQNVDTSTKWKNSVKDERFHSDDESSSRTPPPGGKVHRCDLCNKVFTRSSSLFRHKRIHTGEKPFICAECGKTFTQSGYLMQHMRVHSGDRRFACEECGKMFTDSGNLIQHRRVHTGEKPYGCNVCGMSFTQNGHLARHLKVHSGERPFECELCAKKFTNCSNLSRHAKLHADGKI